ncbi:MAG TPA: LysR family transcriptional regulator [Pseudonocardia sp.]
MEPNVRLLRYFLAIADTGTFTRAAEQLHVSQPALSQQIRKLENELGFPLFHRGTRTVTLTGQGQELLDSARAAVAAADAYDRRARDLGAGSRRLIIGYRAANDLTRRIVTAFGARRPLVEVALRHYPMAAVHAGLDTAEVDLALLRLPVDMTGLDSLTLLTEPRVAVLPRDHPLTRRASIHLSDLDNLSWITTAATDPAWQRHAQPETPNRQLGHAPTIVNTLDEYLEAVTAGRGVALAPLSATRFYPRPGVSYVEVADAEPSTICLAWRRGTPDTNPSVAAFIATATTLVPANQAQR